MAVGNSLSILQVVGYQNSGKTTLLEKLIRMAVQENWRVGTIKHHGHGGTPVAADEQKDSFRHREAGAVVTSVEGDGLLHIHAQRENWPLTDILRLYKSFPLDAIFVEGYKQASYEKAVLIRSMHDINLIGSLTNVICIISWIPLPEKVGEAYKVFYINEENQYIPWLLERMRNSHE